MASHARNIDRLQPVIDYLSRQSDRKIHKFHNQMNELLYALDTKALAEQCQRAYEQANDDTFLYSRCVALINGPEYYAKAKAGLETGMWTMEFEALLYKVLCSLAIKFPPSLFDPHLIRNANQKCRSEVSKFHEAPVLNRYSSSVSQWQCSPISFFISTLSSQKAKPKNSTLFGIQISSISVL